MRYAECSIDYFKKTAESMSKPQFILSIKSLREIARKQISPLNAGPILQRVHKDPNASGLANTVNFLTDILDALSEN